MASCTAGTWPSTSGANGAEPSTGVVGSGADPSSGCAGKGADPSTGGGA